MGGGEAGVARAADRRGRARARAHLDAVASEREVVVDHVSDVLQQRRGMGFSICERPGAPPPTPAAHLDVEAARRHVRRDEDAELGRPELADNARARVLVHVAVQRVNGEARVPERLRDRVAVLLELDENDRLAVVREWLGRVCMWGERRELRRRLAGSPFPASCAAPAESMKRRLYSLMSRSDFSASPCTTVTFCDGGEEERGQALRLPQPAARRLETCLRHRRVGD